MILETILIAKITRTGTANALVALGVIALAFFLALRHAAIIQAWSESYSTLKNEQT